MPANYYAPTNVTDDEAAWIYDPNTIGANDSAIELGWFQGFWPYPGTGYGENFSYPQGYVTFNNGAYGSITTGRLPASNQLQFMIADVGGTGTALQITNNTTGAFYYGINSPYNVTSPRTNMSQGEVAGGSGAWMGGNNGGGTTSYGKYEPNGSQNFNNWGYFTTCDNSPYFINSLSSYSWKNGGK